MILVDSNILIDAIEPHSPFHDWSSGQLMDAVEEGAFINPIVVGEIAPRFSAFPDLVEVLDGFALPVKDISLQVSWAAGRAHLAWIRNGGRRGSLLPDLLIGAHAIVEQASILTRDPRRFRTYFPELNLILPEQTDD
ncbi:MULTISPECIES: type II toxin-antitoxin system VapC family toxin [Novosphingobium]|uniref:type II toxin-antitoxin system VapC family toxin n=1 Tax=Novosphingobium TaxID=165696 RepID=UPI0022F261E8|nr:MULTISPECIES: PIN domain-containing protein [Novosphingobium]GLK46924.1 DNA-binding protein [Novosphingobium resinovorum]